MLADLAENRDGSMLHESLPRSMFDPVQGSPAERK